MMETKTFIFYFLYIFQGYRFVSYVGFTRYVLPDMFSSAKTYRVAGVTYKQICQAELVLFQYVKHTVIKSYLKDFPIHCPVISPVSKDETYEWEGLG